MVGADGHGPWERVVTLARSSRCSASSRRYPAVDHPPSEDVVGYEPASVEPIEGSELSRVYLTEDAARRIGLETAAVARRGDRTAVPESAIRVDVEWEPPGSIPHRSLVFVWAPRGDRDRYEDGSAYLTAGPAPGTEVASIGVPELVGSELASDGSHEGRTDEAMLRWVVEVRA